MIAGSQVNGSLDRKREETSDDGLWKSGKPRTLPTFPQTRLRLLAKSSF